GLHVEPAAKAPWTRTIVLTAAYAGHDAAKAAPVRRARIKRFTAKLRQRSLQDQQATSRVAGRPSPGVLKLAAEFSKPHGTSRGFSSSNAPPLYLFQRARIFRSYDRSNLFFRHRPQSDFTVMKLLPQSFFGFACCGLPRRVAARDEFKPPVRSSCTAQRRRANFIWPCRDSVSIHPDALGAARIADCDDF